MGSLSLGPLARLTPRGLGIGPRIVGLFALVFGLMGGLGLLLMQSKLLPAFDAIEKHIAQDSAKRVTSGIDEQLVALSILNHDWAFWDDLYSHMQHRSKVFEDSNLSDAAMLTSHLNAVLLIDLNHQLAGLGRRPQSDGSLLQPDQVLPPLQRRLAGHPLQSRPTECGLIQVGKILSAVCWTPIVHSDGRGAVTGLVVMVKELGDSAMAVIAQNAGTAFSIEPHVEEPANPNAVELAWELPSFKYFSNREVRATYAPQSITLHYLLRDLENKPLSTVHMDLARNLALQAQRILKEVGMQLASLALVTGLVLLLALHHWLVRPIRQLQGELATMTASRRWDGVLTAKRPDEIGSLTQGVNALLHVLRSQVDALETLSSTDALTGIANRRQFDERLASEIVRLARRPAPLSLLLLDVDHFKRYNDLYGHPMGDVALQQIGTLLQDLCRQQDLPARIGGEEFALLLPETDAAGAIAMADRCMLALAVLALPHDSSPTDRHLTVSIGVATCETGQRTDAKALRVQADEALYTAKDLGRHRVCHRNQTGHTAS
nr:diguanylate cyclase [uncultured Albidiferax sp.]